jgi:hypothetical protein
VPRKPYDRLDPLLLVRGAHVTRDISDEVVRIGTGVACAILLLIATLPWLPSIALTVIVAVLDILGAIYIARCINAAALGNFVHEQWIAPRKLIPDVRYGPRGRITAANSIRAGTWVCNEKEYAHIRKEHNSANGRSAPAPPVPYKLVLATYELNARQQVVAFSDGTSVTWYTTANVIIEDSPEIETLRDYCEDEIIRQLAYKTEQLIELLDENESSASLLSMAARLEAGGDERQMIALAQAIMVALQWNLVTATPARQQTSLTSGGREDADDALIKLRQAGQDWNLASPKFQPLQVKARRNVCADLENSPSIKIHTFAGILNVGKKISGSHSSWVHQTQISDAAILSCLEEILNSQQILWAEPDLSEVRRIIQEALVQQNPRAPGLRQAVIKLGGLCGDLLKGVLSNGAYAVLMHFLS